MSPMSPMSPMSRREWLALAGCGTAALGLAPGRALASSAPTEWRFGKVTVTKVLDVVEPFDAARAYPGAPLEAFGENASRDSVGCATLSAGVAEKFAPSYAFHRS